MKRYQRRMLQWMAAYIAMLFFLATHHAFGQHNHPPQDVPIHEQFYSTWVKPDNPKASCCSKQDCYPTEVRFRDGDIYAKRREDGIWMRVPPQKIERHRDNPDGRNHVCAPPPYQLFPDGQVFCFILGTGG